jgi:hypothetical protein
MIIIRIIGKVSADGFVTISIFLNKHSYRDKGRIAAVYIAAFKINKKKEKAFIHPRIFTNHIAHESIM